MPDFKSFLTRLPHHPGIYQMLDERGNVLYVGKAKNLKKRISSYFSSRSKDIKTLTLVKQIAAIDFTTTRTEAEAVLLECNLIKQHRPRYNVLLRDDKSYPYILISAQHPYPRIDFYRGPRRKNALYFGPYPNAQTVREVISLLQKTFRIRTCRDSYFAARIRPCLLYQINRCTGPCVKLIDQAAYTQNIERAILFLQGKSEQVIDKLQLQMEEAAKSLQFELAATYRDQISRLRQVQDKQYINLKEGEADVIGFAAESGISCIQLLTVRAGQILGSRSYFPHIPNHVEKEEVLTAFLTQHYLSSQSHIESIPKQILVDTTLPEQTMIEAALALQSKHKVSVVHVQKGEKAKWLQIAALSAKQSLAAHLLNKVDIKERVQALQDLLAISHAIHRIECFDVSHTMGEATVASCVVFDQMGPVKSAYRRYNIIGVTPGDDVAAMRQVLLRRFKKQQQDGVLPDLVLIDGGPTQLSAATTVLETLKITSLVLLGVSKGPGRKAGYESLHFINQPPIHLSPDSPALHLIQQIRDEAHRFAITGHRQRRDKARRQSSLEAIPGIGAKRRRELLRYFGGIQGVARASLDELMNVAGINRSIAEKIFAAFHDNTL